MKIIDTKNWGTFIIGDLMYKLDLRIIKDDFDKRLDTSLEQNDEFSLPLINAKDGNNGIMYYGRPGDFESDEMCIGIVQNGAVATGNVYAHIDRTGVLWDAYLVKTIETISKYSLLYVSKVMQLVIKSKYSYDNKAIWDKVKLDSIYLPQTPEGAPDWIYMDNYMKEVEKDVKIKLDKLLAM